MFTEGDGDGIKSRLPFKIFSTLKLAGQGDKDRLEQIRLRRVYYSSVKHCLKSDTSEGGLNSDLSLTYKKRS